MASRIWFATLLAVAISAGATAVAALNVTCPSSPLEPGRYELDLPFGGLERRFIVYVPTSYNNTPTPVFLNFHGFLMAMNWEYELTGMPIVSEEEGFIAVVPQGYRASWNAGACCGTAQQENLDDVGFVRAMVELVSTVVCIDRDRIFSAGYSNGGYLSYRLACEASDLVRAVAPNAGLLSSERYFPCNQTKPVPIMVRKAATYRTTLVSTTYFTWRSYGLLKRLEPASIGGGVTLVQANGVVGVRQHFHGTEDRLVSYEGGVQSIERYAKEIIGCTDTPLVTFKNNTVTCETWSQCAQGSEATFCTIEGGEHYWPGCFTTLGCRRATQDINATREMWKFFERVSRAVRR